MSVKRNRRTAECPVDIQGVNAPREFQRNIECLKAETSDSQLRKNKARTRERYVILRIDK